MLGTTIETRLDLIFIQCNGNGKSCGGTYAVNKEWYENRRKFGGTWYCPYCGTSWVASENTIAELQRKLNEAVCAASKTLAAVEQQKQAALDEAKHFRLSRDRLLSRANKGVCPHCNRHFKNVQRHVECKHKDKI